MYARRPRNLFVRVAAERVNLRTYNAQVVQGEIGVWKEHVDGGSGGGGGGKHTHLYGCRSNTVVPVFFLHTTFFTFFI